MSKVLNSHDEHSAVNRLRSRLPALVGTPDDTTGMMFTRLYDDLNIVASRVLAFEHRPPLSTQELVHELYLRVKGRASHRGPDRILRLAARAMRYVLVDRARMSRAQKRPQQSQRTTLSGLVQRRSFTPAEMLDLEEALTELGHRNKRQLAVVELNFFVGLTQEEIAECLGVSLPTVERDMRLAKAKLARFLQAYDDES